METVGLEETVEIGEAVGLVETVDLGEAGVDKMEGLSWQEGHIGEQEGFRAGALGRGGGHGEVTLSAMRGLALCGGFPFFLLVCVWSEWGQTIPDKELFLLFVWWCLASFSCL